MLEEILKEIEDMEYPLQAISCGLENECITDRYAAAAYGFTEARERITGIVRGHLEDDGWIPCSDRMPEEEKYYIVTYEFDNDDEKRLRCHELYYGVADGDAGWYIDDGFERLYRPFTVIAWRPLPEAYRPRQKAVGEDYKQRTMERFMKVE